MTAAFLELRFTGTFVKKKIKMRAQFCPKKQEQLRSQLLDLEPTGFNQSPPHPEKYKRDYPYRYSFISGPRSAQDAQLFSPKISFPQYAM